MNSKQKWLTGIAGAVLVLTSPILARADAKGAALLKEVEQATKAIKTLSGVLTATNKFGGQTQVTKGKFRLKRPNLLFVEMKGNDPATMASNGKDFTVFMTNQNQYMKTKADPNGKGMGASLLMMLYFDAPSFFSRLQPTYAGTETIGGKTYSIVTASMRAEQSFRFRISPEKLVTYFKMEVKDANGKISVTEEETFSDLVFNALIPNRRFAYAPPKDATLYKEPSYDEKLLPVSSRAPEFNLATPDGGRVSLDKTLKEQKAVLVNFWFYG